MPALPLAALQIALIAGGAEASINYNSHRVHIETLAQRLVAEGVPAGQITIFWADGRAKGVDRAELPAVEPIEGAWLIEGTDVDEATRRPPDLKNTRIRGFTVRPATRKAIQRWIVRVGAAAGPEDTVLMAVTDHGEPDPQGAGETAVSLWGERWTVSQARADLAPLDPAGRVVLWMSQCFSGGFSALHHERPNLCGAFSTTPDRVAYGCYPDLAVKHDVGHFMRMVQALEVEPRLSAASDRVALTDDTPDVPHLTSDALLFEALTYAAERRQMPLARLIDLKLARIPADHPVRAQVQGIAERYTLGDLPSYAAVETALEALDTRRLQLLTWSEARAEALNLVRQTLVSDRRDRWLAAAKKARPRRLRALRRKAVTRAHQVLGRHSNLKPVIRRLSDSVDRGWQIERTLALKEAALLRVAYLYGRLAGRGVLAPDQRRRLVDLEACEAAPLWPGQGAAGPPAVDSPAVDSPAVDSPAVARPLEADEALSRAIEALRPAFLGIRFTPDAAQPGAVKITDVLPDEAAASTLRVGDVLTGLNGQPLALAGELPVRLAASPPGVPLVISGQREGVERAWTLTPGLAPLPVSPQAFDTEVPPLPLTPLSDSETTPLPIPGEGQPVVLFFWATWCKPCKAAIPTLIHWADEHDAQIIAVTREPAETVSGFLTRFKAAGGRFPFPVALDRTGRVQQRFVAEVTPTFVFLDAAGRFVDVGEGFDGVIPLRGVD